MTSEPSGPYLFDVGVVALAHANTPVSNSALSYVRDAIRGEIDAIVPHPVLFGAHVVLSNYYGFSNAQATRLMSNFMDAERIHWHDDLSEPVVSDGFQRAAELNIEGWGGYYAAVAASEGVNTILTLDDNFDRVDGVSAKVILSPDEFETLNNYLSG